MYSLSIDLFLFQEEIKVDTENIQRFRQPYLTMSQYGLFVHDLRGDYTRGAFWQVQVTMLNPMDPDVAKALVAGWLESEYRAESITFFKRSSDKSNQFRVQFVRKDC